VLGNSRAPFILLSWLHTQNQSRSLATLTRNLFAITFLGNRHCARRARHGRQRLTGTATQRATRWFAGILPNDVEACSGRADVTFRAFLSGRSLRPWQPRIAWRSLVSFRPLWPRRTLLSFGPLRPCRALLAPRPGRSGWPGHALVAFCTLRPCRSLFAFGPLLLLPAGGQEHGRRYHKER
jgi:hypothetical protein